MHFGRPGSGAGHIEELSVIAVLDASDLFWIWLIVIVFAGGTAAYLRPTEGARVQRIEKKLDAILRHLGIYFRGAAAGLSAEVRALADDPAKKIQAIALHRDQTGVGLKDAKEAVEAYIAGRS
jgi:hypothetical protein